ncbi:Heat shock transcription factor, partial [Basidiobolus ranarum]
MTQNTVNITPKQLIPNVDGNVKLPLLTQLPDSPTPIITTPAHTPSPPATPNIGSSTRTHNTKNVPAFLNKLHKMVGDSSTNELIRWSDDGTSFIVTKHEEFAKEVLPRFFKHNNFSSFVRQLNMYGFHKIPHLQQGVLQSDEGAEHWEFSNPHFLKNQPDLLYLVTRKRGREVDEKEGGGLDLNNVMGEIASIRKHQLTISADLRNLQKENQQLWQETLSSREKYNGQQETIDKILRFLASVFSSDKKSKEIIPRKRRLLLGNTDDTQAEYEDFQDLNLDFDPSTMDFSSALNIPGFDPSIFTSTQQNVTSHGTTHSYTEPSKCATPANPNPKSDAPSSIDLLTAKHSLPQPSGVSALIAPNIELPVPNPAASHTLPSNNSGISSQPIGSMKSSPVNIAPNPQLNSIHDTPSNCLNGTYKSLEDITCEMDQLNQNIESLASSLGIDPLLASDPVLNIGDIDMNAFLSNYPN